MSIVVRGNIACTPGWTSWCHIWEKDVSHHLIDLRWKTVKGVGKKCCEGQGFFSMCIKLFKLICNFFKNWLYVKYQLLNLYVAVNYFEGQLVFLTWGNPKYVWSRDGREASSAKYPPLPTPSSDTWWGSFLALDGHLLGKGVYLKGAKKLKKFIDDEIIPTHMQRPPKLLFIILIKENPALPHNIQNSFMSNGVSGTEAFLAPLDGCPGAIPGKGFWHLWLISAGKQYNCIVIVTFL